MIEVTIHASHSKTTMWVFHAFTIVSACSKVNRVGVKWLESGWREFTMKKKVAATKQRKKGLTKQGKKKENVWRERSTWDHSLVPLISFKYNYLFKSLLPFSQASFQFCPFLFCPFPLSKLLYNSVVWISYLLSK